MILIGTSESAPLVVNVMMTSPFVYLDYCVVSDFASDSKLGDEFRDILLSKGGTLYVSTAHVTELLV